MAKRTAATNTRRGDLERATRWSGLQPGDRVVVNTPKELSHNYEFVAFVVNHATNERWVEVRGGRAGEAKDRSFKPELIYPLSSRQGAKLRGLSLVDAPQLPWA